MKVSEDVLAQFRHHKSRTGFHGSSYPYLVGRIEGILKDPTISNKVKVEMCLENLAALDIINGGV